MGNVVAINEISAQAIEKMQMDCMEKEFKDFIKNDPEVRQMMLEKVKSIVDGMSNFDVSYHGGFRETTAAILASPEMRPHLETALSRIITSAKEYDYRIMEAIGQVLAENLTLGVRP